VMQLEFLGLVWISFYFYFLGKSFLFSLLKPIAAGQVVGQNSSIELIQNNLIDW